MIKRRRYTGLNLTPKIRIASNCNGRGASYVGRSHIERGGGLHTSENAGMSSETGVRISSVECPRFPGEGSSSQGKSGPKLRAKAIGDG